MGESKAERGAIPQQVPRHATLAATSHVTQRVKRIWFRTLTLTICVL